MELDDHLGHLIDDVWGGRRGHLHMQQLPIPCARTARFAEANIFHAIGSISVSSVPSRRARVEESIRRTNIPRLGVNMKTTRPKELRNSRLVSLTSGSKINMGFSGREVFDPTRRRNKISSQTYPSSSLTAMGHQLSLIQPLELRSESMR